MPAAQPSSSDTPALWNIAQCANRLNVTVRHVRRLVSEKRIPYIKWGHLLRFDPIEIERWIDQARWNRPESA